MPVHEYVSPEVFESWRVRALEKGFLYVASGPLVRSSYKAGEAFIENVLKKKAGRGGAVGVEGEQGRGMGVDVAAMDATGGI